MRRAVTNDLTEAERVTLVKWSRGKRTAARVVERTRIILLAADGLENREIAQQLGVTQPTVGKWRKRFSQDRLAGIEKDLPRGGRKQSVRGRLEAEIIRKTTQEKPAAATQWSVRTLAKAWLAKHPRFHRHFIPTSSSWLNIIERWFRNITQDRIRNGVFRSKEELIEAINDYIRHHNENPTTFVWTKSAEQILEKVSRAKAALNNSTTA